MWHVSIEQMFTNPIKNVCEKHILLKKKKNVTF
jgi:hypothetical protein